MSRGDQPASSCPPSRGRLRHVRLVMAASLMSSAVVLMPHGVVFAVAALALCAVAVTPPLPLVGRAPAIGVASGLALLSFAGTSHPMIGRASAAGAALALALLSRAS